MDVDHVSYIEKFICIETVNGKSLRGECFTIDPVTKSVVMIIQNNENKFVVEIIMQHAVKTIRVEENSTFTDVLSLALFKTQLNDKIFGGMNNFDKKTLNERKTILLGWLRKNQLPVQLTDSDSLSVVNGIAMIEPPYTVESCRSTNTIVLDKVMKMIRACPGLH